MLGCFISSTIVGCLVKTRAIIPIQYLNEACIKPHHRYHYLTCEEIDVMIGSQEIIIPAGFDTDLATIPRWLWTFLSPSYSGFVAPSILHDYLYTCPGGFSREFADLVFYSGLLKNGVSNFTASKMYFAVRLFGHGHFNKGNYCEGINEQQ